MSQKLDAPSSDTQPLTKIGKLIQNMSIGNIVRATSVAAALFLSAEGCMITLEPESSGGAAAKDAGNQADGGRPDSETDGQDSERQDAESKDLGGPDLGGPDLGAPDSGGQSDGGINERDTGGEDLGARDSGAQFDGSADGGQDGGTDAGPAVCPKESCTVGTGKCERQGEKLCDANGQFTGECSAQPGEPENQEICANELDDDCNGVIDDTCVCDIGEVQNCYTGGDDIRGIGECHDGIQACTDGRWNPLCNDEKLPSPELQNSLDDDCDGVTDEGFPCSAGIGACQRGGIIQEDGICSTQGGEPAPEQCNDADDDCDGATDEDLTRPCTIGCNEGTEVCEDGEFVGCDALVQPEIPANLADDDCNGWTDEVLDEINGQCQRYASIALCNFANPECQGGELFVIPRGCGSSAFTFSAEQPADQSSPVAHTTFLTLAPVGSAPYTRVTAYSMAQAWGFARREATISNVCPEGLPPPPQGLETRCIITPARGSSEGGLLSLVEISIVP